MEVSAHTQESIGPRLQQSSRAKTRVTPSPLGHALVRLAASVGWLFALPAQAADAPVNPTLLPFSPGGVVVMKINQGAVEVVGTAASQISVAWEGRSRDEERNVKVRLQRSGDKEATLLIDNWYDHLRFRIEVPRDSDVAIHMRAGELKIGGIAGSMDADLIAGEMNVRVPDPSRYRAVSASVTAGQLTATPWRTDTAGIWRSFKATGKGDLELRARLIAGELTIGAE